MFCTQCGANNADTAVTCVQCGRPLHGAQPQAPTGVVQPPGYQQPGYQQPVFVQNYLVPAILVTIFCCLPAGIVAIVYAAQVNGKLAGGGRGRRDGFVQECQDLVLGFSRSGPSRYRRLGPADVLGCPEQFPSVSASTQLVCPSAPTRTCAELLAGLGLIAASVAVLRFLDPANSVVFPPCPLHWLTGIYCPGCGSLRACHQLLHGNLGNALAFNPFAVLTLPFLAYGVLSTAVFRIRGRYLPRVFLPAGWIWTLGLAILVFGIARNIPMYPFSLLAPGAMLAR